MPAHFSSRAAAVGLPTSKVLLPAPHSCHRQTAAGGEGGGGAKGGLTLATHAC